MLFPLNAATAIKDGMIIYNKRGSMHDITLNRSPRRLTFLSQHWPGSLENLTESTRTSFVLLPDSSIVVDQEEAIITFISLASLNNYMTVSKIYGDKPFSLDERQRAEALIVKLKCLLLEMYWPEGATKSSAFCLFSDGKIGMLVFSPIEEACKLEMQEAVILDSNYGNLAMFKNSNDNYRSGMAAILDNTKTHQQALDAFHRMNLFKGESWETLESYFNSARPQCEGTYWRTTYLQLSCALSVLTRNGFAFDNLTTEEILEHMLGEPDAKEGDPCR